MLYMERVLSILRCVFSESHDTPQPTYKIVAKLRGVGGAISHASSQSAAMIRVTSFVVLVLCAASSLATYVPSWNKP